jgi:hypothetical protein
MMLPVSNCNDDDDDLEISGLLTHTPNPLPDLPDLVLDRSHRLSICHPQPTNTPHNLLASLERPLSPLGSPTHSHKSKRSIRRMSSTNQSYHVSSHTDFIGIYHIRERRTEKKPNLFMTLI